jgi:DNA-binding MarR family transcriptional regulator
MVTTPEGSSERTGAGLTLSGPPLPWLLRRVNQRYRAAMGDKLREAGIEDVPQLGYWALMALSRGANDASQLVGEMGATKQAVSRLLDTLAVAGFVDRNANLADRRRTDLRLTSRGRDAVRIIESAARDTERAFVVELGAQSYAQLVRTLEQLARKEE